MTLPSIPGVRETEVAVGVSRRLRSAGREMRGKLKGWGMTALVELLPPALHYAFATACGRASKHDGGRGDRRRPFRQPNPVL